MITVLMIFTMLLMGCGTISRMVYVKPTIPPLPEKPSYYSMKFDKNYCLSEQDARNMLKNKSLLDGYVKELETILEGLR